MTKHLSHAQSDREKTMKTYLEKIVVNAGIGRLSQQPSFEEKLLPQVIRDLELIAGQRPQVRRAKKSIAGFKMREGQIIGLRVTLRHRKMVDFFERLITIVLPRVHDFRGVSDDSIDAGGVLNIGFREQFVFPEVNPEESPLTFSLGVNLVPRKRSRIAALDVYRAAGFPFAKKTEKK